MAGNSFFKLIKMMRWQLGWDGMSLAWESVWKIKLIVTFQLNLPELSPNCAGYPAMDSVGFPTVLGGRV